MKVELRKPDQLSGDELDRIAGLLDEGGEVSLARLPERLSRVVVFALLRDGAGAIVGVAALKRPAAASRRRLAERAGAPEIVSHREELGYLYLVPELRGRGYGERLVREALTRAKGPVLATARNDNLAMRALLPRFGFAQVGSSWRSPRGGHLGLWLRPVAAPKRRTADRRPAVLIIGLQSRRWATVRLAAALRSAGCRVGIAAPAGSLAFEVRAADAVYPLASPRRGKEVLRATIDAISAFDPTAVVPADHMTCALLQRYAGALRADPERKRLVRRSLGDFRSFSDRLLKESAIARAAAAGLNVPRSAMVDDLDAAADFAAGAYPVILKQNYGTGGYGVALCRGEEDLERAFARLADPPTDPDLRPHRRRHRFEPAPGPLQIQDYIRGVPAMSAAVAWQGEVVASLCGVAERTVRPNGAGSLVRLRRHPEIERMTAELAACFGASGFISFDFVIEHGSGRVVFLECNPRPIGITHLGARVGVDLAAAFRDTFAERPRRAAPPADYDLRVAVFPNAWTGDGPAALPDGIELDIPFDEPEALLRYCERTGLSLPPSLTDSLPLMLDAAE